MVRYTLLRFLIFFGCLSLFWLLGLRETNQLPWLAVSAAIASMVISAIVLKPFRADMIQQLEGRRERKQAERAERTDTDEAVEDGANGESEEETYR